MNIKQTTINGIPALLVQLPEDATRFKVFNDNPMTYLSVFVESESLTFREYIPVAPTGYSWRFINLTKDLTEEQVKELLRKYADGFQIVTYVDDRKEIIDKNPVDCFVSFLQKHGVIDRMTEQKPDYNEYHSDRTKSTYSYLQALERYELQKRSLSTWGLIVGEKVN